MDKSYNKNFIAFEGGEGSGKTTTSNLLKEKLEEKGYRVLVTREPGGTYVSEKIRDLILENEIDIKTEVLLFAAARREHLVEKIIPALEKGMIVISDRFVDSSIVYQSYIGLADKVEEINDYVIDIYPNYVFFFDIPPKLALKRIEDRQNNRFDNKDLTFHNKIYEGYKNLLKINPRIKSINAVLSQEVIVKKILEELEL